ncbi:MAG: hypothetical protein IJ193_00760 [Bacilli bacterium]|nr:hypothetical protein [Bacilli bacterium]
MYINQRQFIHDFVDKYSNDFNTNLFKRSDEAIIDQLKQIILSLQTTYSEDKNSSFFTIKVVGFDVIDKYSEIAETMRNWYNASIKTSKSGRKSDEDNKYDYIDLKSSDIKLLIVHYYIAIKDEEGYADVIIQIPRVVNKFYFYLNGNYYSAMYQIVDASTYNNSSTKGQKSSCVTFKTNLQPIRIYKHDYIVKDTQGVEHTLTEYDCNAFNKTVPTVNYIFAKYGLFEGLKLFNLHNFIRVTQEDQSDDYTYSFLGKRSNGIYVNVTKNFLDTAPVVQHIVYTICNSIEADTTIDYLYGTEFWIAKLGSSFNSSNRLTKGYNVQISIESVLDMNIRNQLHLPWEWKQDIYHILAWILLEFGLLKLKDNLDITTKKIRYAEYIAAIYANKLSLGIYRLSNKGKRADLKDIKRVIYTKPDFLINEIIKSQLVTFKNIVNDMDAFLPLKFTYKGISGIGESSSSIPDQFRLLDISNMGILDPDASSPSDPGVNGSLTPFATVYDNGYFSNNSEPLTWEKEFNKLYNEYKQSRDLVDVVEFRNNMLGENTDTSVMKQSSDVLANICETVAKSAIEKDILTNAIDSVTGERINLEESGLLYYE